MAQDDPEQRIAEPARQLAAAQAAAHERQNPAGADPAEAQAPFAAPPQAPFPAHLQASSWNTFGNGQPMVPGASFPGAPLGSPFAQPSGPAAFRLTGGQRFLRGLGHLLWWAAIAALIYGFSLGVKVHRVSQGGQNAKCGNVFDATFGHGGYYQFGGADTLRSACADQIAKAQTMTWGLIAFGALLILASFVVLLITWIIKWRLGWRPWRSRTYRSGGFVHGPYGRMR
jgi:hypothetical protein